VDNMSGDQIRQLRLAMRLTQKELGSLIGVPWLTISRWENNHNKPSPLARKALSALRIKQDQGRLVRNSLT
jgi:putative transcriptional regulator